MRYISGSKVIVLGKGVPGEVTEVVIPRSDPSKKILYRGKTEGETFIRYEDELLEDNELTRALHLKPN